MLYSYENKILFENCIFMNLLNEILRISTQFYEYYLPL